MQRAYTTHQVDGLGQGRGLEGRGVGARGARGAEAGAAGEGGDVQVAAAELLGRERGGVALVAVSVGWD